MTLPPPPRGCETSRNVPPLASDEPATLEEAEYQAILSAIGSSDRGRRFLAEYHRRRCAGEARRLLPLLRGLEAHALGVAAERTRIRIGSERAAEVVRRLTQTLEELRPLAEASVQARVAQAREATTRGHRASGGLERRFAALVDLDQRDLENGLKLLG